MTIYYAQYICVIILGRVQLRDSFAFCSIDRDHLEVGDWLWRNPGDFTHVSGVLVRRSCHPEHLPYLQFWGGEISYMISDFSPSNCLPPNQEEFAWPFLT